MEARARIPVTLPCDHPTTAFWQDPPDPAVAGLQSTAALPAAVEVVIVGSGITGASVAWHLLGDEEDAAVDMTSPGAPPPRVLMLEARQAASGATGRNGGHTKAASYWSFPAHAAAHGTAVAVQIARLELAGIRAVHAMAAGGSIPCDSHPCDTIDIVYDPAKWALAQAAIAAMRAALPPDDPAAAYRLYSRAEALAAFPCCDDDATGARVCGAVRYEAGSISAYRFTAGVLARCLARGLELHTHTPVLALERGSSSNDGDDTRHRWTVRTPRGPVAARHVVLATNAYTAFLVPALKGVVVPLRGQIAMHRPAAAAPDPLPYTYSFVYAAGYDYLVTRPPGATAAGDLVLGGGLAFAGGDAEDEDGADGEYGTTDDTTLNTAVSAYLRAAPGRYFGWQPAAAAGENEAGRGVRAEWTGIMGYTPDGLPLVGAMSGPTDKTEDGLWLCCAFQGHGMVYSWPCGRAVAAMVRGRDGPALRQWFPDCFRVRPERLRQPFVGRQHGAVKTAVAEDTRRTG